jgi:hypothetical protein
MGSPLTPPPNSESASTSPKNTGALDGAYAAYYDSLYSTPAAQYPVAQFPAAQETAAQVSSISPSHNAGEFPALAHTEKLPQPLKNILHLLIYLLCFISSLIIFLIIYFFLELKFLLLILPVLI